MKPSVTIMVNPDARHQTEHGKAIAEGFTRNGHRVRVISSGDRPTGDVFVAWGWKNGRRIRHETSAPVLVMERGYVGDRFLWTSLGWNGLNGRAVFPIIDDPRRWDRHLARYMAPPARVRPLAVVMGQVEGDAALADVNFRGWCEKVMGQLVDCGWSVVFRPHPLAVQRRQRLPRIPSGVLTSISSLSADLTRAGLVVTFNSNSAVDAVLAGVPAYAEDEGSMIWPIRAKDITDPILPDRSNWAARIAWAQWLPHELSDGTAVAAVMEAFPR